MLFSMGAGAVQASLGTGIAVDLNVDPIVNNRAAAARLAIALDAIAHMHASVRARPRLRYTTRARMHPRPYPSCEAPAGLRAQPQLRAAVALANQISKRMRLQRSGCHNRADQQLS